MVLIKNKKIKDFFEIHSLADLHCHILPGIDDGAQDIEQSRAILHKESEDGVKSIAFSPHFYSDRMELERFLYDRERAFDGIKNEHGFDFKVWSEVAVSPDMADIAFEKLSLNNKYLLVEFPFYQNPIWGEYIIDEIVSRGLIPVLAHFERYKYIAENQQEISKYLRLGCLFQMNAGTVIHNPKFAADMIKKGVVDVIATDTHNTETRSPNLKKAYEIVIEKCGVDAAERLLNSAKKIFG